MHCVMLSIKYVVELSVADPEFPVWGCQPHWGRADVWCGGFVAKIYAKTKELGPIGGGCLQILKFRVFK